MKNIKHVFFDLDHTLWDYEKNSIETLTDLVYKFGIDKQVTVEKFLKVYQSVNEKLWHKFNNGQIDKAHIQQYRFPQVLRKLKVYIDHEPSDLSDYFINNCSIKPGLMPHTLTALNYLKEKYPMAIISNGFPEAQHPKMKSSGLDQYFDKVIISELVGWRKPQPEIYQHALSEMNASAATSVMIGDNPKTDIRGAEQAGLKAIFYNPTGNRKSVTEWEIQSLEELVGIL